MFFASWQPCLQEVARLHLTLQLPITPRGSVHLGDLAPGSEAQPSPALTFGDRGLLEPIRMEVQSLRVMTSGAGTVGVQHRNLSWIFWLVLPFAAQRSHVARPKWMANLSYPPITRP